MPYLFTFREILNLAIEFGRSLSRKHLIPRYFNIDRYARQKYGLISMCILSFDTSTTWGHILQQYLDKVTLDLTKGFEFQYISIANSGLILMQ